ncbi:DUF4199 domain-containing protein [Flavobacterium sp. XGLA_31]|uniref:DUF4199 domain-containing protein n=1 Tax=Flavobacterium sp. XGLA_31 TaxID=3447666 RepID=UPI003F3FC6AB
MDKPISPAKSALQFGVLFGVLMILELVISFATSINPATNKAYGIVINLLNFLIMPAGLILMGCNNFKNKINSGYISLSEALKVGVTICVIAALLYGIFSGVFNMIFPEFVEETLRNAKTAMLQQNPEMPKEQVEIAISFTKKFMNPAIAIPATVIMYAFIGLIYSLIIGAIVKKEAHQSF